MKLKRRPDLSHLPGHYGLPLLGVNVSLLRDPLQLFHRYYQTYGPVSRLSIGGYQSVLLIGPESMQSLMLDREQNFSAKGGWGSMMPDLFSGSVLLRDFDEHRVHRRIMQTAFKSETLRAYIPQINQIVEDSVDRWRRQPSVLYFHEVKRLLLDIAFQIFCYVDASATEREAVNQAFTDMMEGSLAYVRVDMPGFLYRRAMRGRRYLEQYFMSQVSKKRASGHQDAFSYFCHEKKENGEYFTDKEIADHMVFLMLAAHDTTTSAITMAAYYLANDVSMQDALHQEASGIQSALSYDDIRQHLPLSEQVFKEAIRLHPAVSIIFRSTLRDCEVAGHAIPAGTLLLAPTIYNHRLDSWWQQPDQFNPGRFADDSNEHKQHSFQWTPFGGGAHKCIGLNFADILFKAVFYALMKDYRIEYAKGESYPMTLQHFPFAKPVNDLPLTLRPVDT